MDIKTISNGASAVPYITESPITNINNLIITQENNNCGSEYTALTESLYKKSRLFVIIELSFDILFLIIILFGSYKVLKLTRLSNWRINFLVLGFNLIILLDAIKSLFMINEIDRRIEN
jgi:hypothetical protein